MQKYIAALLLSVSLSAFGQVVDNCPDTAYKLKFPPAGWWVKVKSSAFDPADARSVDFHYDLTNSEVVCIYNLKGLGTLWLAHSYSNPQPIKPEEPQCRGQMELTEDNAKKCGWTYSVTSKSAN